MSFLQSRTRSAPGGFGQPVRRQEDARLLVGAGCFSDDVNLPGQAYASFVRSPHAHADLRRVETAPALATPGVIAVLTGADAAADGVKPITHSPLVGNPHEEIVRSGDVAFVAPHPPMPSDRVRFVGEIVAMVVADTPAAARDGAERVVAELTPLPAVTASLAAARPGAPILWEKTASNVCADAEAGDAAAVERAFAGAAHVVRLHTWVQRVTGVPMAVLLAAGTRGKRHALPNARMMIHQPWGQIGQGQAVDLGIQAQEFLRTKRLREEILARHTGQPVDKVHRDTDRDYYMDPEEARAYGIIDGICARRSAIVPATPSPNGVQR